MIDTIINYVLGLAQSLPLGVQILSIMGTLDVVCTFIVKATKTLKDDEALQKLVDHKVWGPLLKALEKFSYVGLVKK